MHPPPQIGLVFFLSEWSSSPSLGAIQAQAHGLQQRRLAGAVFAADDDQRLPVLGSQVELLLTPVNAEVE